MKLDGINFSKYKQGLSPLVLALSLTLAPVALSEEHQAETYAEQWESLSEAGKSLAGAVWEITKHTGKDVAGKGKQALNATKDLLSRESTETTPEDASSI